MEIFLISTLEFNYMGKMDKINPEISPKSRNKIMRL